MIEKCKSLVRVKFSRFNLTFIFLIATISLGALLISGDLVVFLIVAGVLTGGILIGLIASLLHTLRNPNIFFIDEGRPLKMLSGATGRDAEVKKRRQVACDPIVSLKCPHCGYYNDLKAKWCIRCERKLVK